MKSLLIAALLSQASLALAVSRDDDWGVGGPKVQYLSWCNRNVLTTQTPQGLAVPKFDCSDYQRVCKQIETKQGPYLFISASCVDPRTNR